MVNWGFAIRARVEIIILQKCPALKFRQFIARLYISSSSNGPMAIRTRETAALNTIFTTLVILTLVGPTIYPRYSKSVMLPILHPDNFFGHPPNHGRPVKNNDFKFSLACWRNLRVKSYDHQNDPIKLLRKPLINTVQPTPSLNIACIKHLWIAQFYHGINPNLNS